MEGFDREKFVSIALNEALNKNTWKGPDSEAYKYTKKFIPWFGKGRFEWCAAFVVWCLEEAGVHLDLKPSCDMGDFHYTWALVETWQRWSQKQGFYIKNDGNYHPKPGDLVIFDWEQKRLNDPDTNWESHIGVFYKEDTTSAFIPRLGKNAIQMHNFFCLEGNVANSTTMKIRNPVTIDGFVSLPDGIKSI